MIFRKLHITARLRLAHMHMPQKTYTMILAAVVGVATGLACVLLKKLIALVSHGVTGVFSHGYHWILLLMPLVGLILAAIFCRYILHRNLTLGTDRLIKFLHDGGYAIDKKLMFGPIVANVLTLGFGGSAGAEGPIAVTGAALSGNIARRLGLTPQQIRIFIGCGAGAGIAAIFKAPVGNTSSTIHHIYGSGPAAVVPGIGHDMLYIHRLHIRCFSQLG